MTERQAGGAVRSAAAGAASVEPVAIVGVGVIGRSWARAFARAGFPTRLYDRAPGVARAALDRIAAEVAADETLGVESVAARQAGLEHLTICDRIDDAVAGVQYVQESGPETLAAKRAILAELAGITGPDTIIASSTSTLDPDAITAGSEAAGRYLVAHPVNPPHLIPVVEVLGAGATDPRLVERACRLLRAIGQQPVVLRKFVPGFLVNRLQAGLLREAIALVANGVADAEAVDAVVRDGLGLRWAVLGPFGVAATNAEGGVGDYLTRFRAPLTAIMDSLSPTPELSPETIARLDASAKAMIGEIPLDQLRRTRDVLVHRIRELKQAGAAVER